ncbi:MAG: DUF4189 domain-containing protein [Alphaproteobacteria bacterium]|nr:DUF4189 domain-containing protein [Alphaproteobacteria bacterium]MCW5741564.1 DUF4189 domain-containing protein [Alphaproteobacteria bacterium]
MRHGTLLAAIAFAALLDPAMARADGALAVGLPANVERDGVAFGWAVRLPRADAERVALEQCRSAPGTPDGARSLCRVFESFSEACVAIALDPEDGTPGFGWAVAPTKSGAEAQALGDCQRSAGAARQAFCAISVSDCDVGR